MIISTVTGIFFKLPAGVLSNVIGRTRTLLLGLTIFAVVPLAYLWVSSFEWLVVVRFPMGLRRPSIALRSGRLWLVLQETGEQSCAPGSPQSRSLAISLLPWVDCCSICSVVTPDHTLNIFISYMASLVEIEIGLLAVEFVEKRYQVLQTAAKRVPGMTASYSHGGPAWDQKLRDAVTKLDSAFKLSYERPAVAVGDPNLLKSGEPAGTRTQGPRLKRAMLYRLSYRLTTGC